MMIIAITRAKDQRILLGSQNHHCNLKVHFDVICGEWKHPVGMWLWDTQASSSHAPNKRRNTRYLVWKALQEKTTCNYWLIPYVTKDRLYSNTLTKLWLILSSCLSHLSSYQSIFPLNTHSPHTWGLRCLGYSRWILDLTPSLKTPLGWKVSPLLLLWG